VEPEDEEIEEDNDGNDDEIDDRYGHSCDFPLMELPTGELNRGEV
jgi:hypothetical protein